MPDQLLSIDDVVRLTGLEESLIRFYESEYPAELPKKILLGGALFFAPASIAAFAGIHARQQGAESGQQRKKERFARVITVTSGKGGVGKTNLALNLAIEFQRLGKMSVVLDADMGLANVHLLAGLTPRHNLTDLLSGRVEMAELIEAGPEGIGIIAGGSGILDLADSRAQDRCRIIESLVQLERAAEIILVDTGAGMGRSVRDFLQAADEILFVITPDITSLTDAYGLLKALHQENLPNLPIHLVVNMVQSLKQAADVSLRFSSCAREFLGRDIIDAGYILKDNTVSQATARRTPHSIYRPNARVSKNTRTIAANLLQKEQKHSSASSAFARYLNLIKNGQQPLPQPRRKTA
ncbi:MAG: P-loop NTPase [Proteobacteria bacterium]|nr:P-loop NTPase [Pseudomonadota bacterium]MBU4297919.1 P-loop NTPase [Pseudomonadota bacterium]MCG2746039.1 AAA family ATPase [Desulfobulbaceae bacterium]